MIGGIRMRNNEMTHQEMNEMRKEMGTLPNEENTPKTKFHIGVQGIKVDMIEWPDNPYRSIFEASVATWGNEKYGLKWGRTTPENRFRVVKAALSGQTLPQALETANFMFRIRGASRSQFDQHARMRIGATFFSQGVRDNSRADGGFRIPTNISELEDQKLLGDIIAHVKKGKELYREVLETGKGSYQSARSILPMGITHNYKWACNLQALKGYMAQRLQACEQEDTVFVAIATRNEIAGRFPLIASHLKPGCDYARKCTYHQAYTLSEMFGCLFAGCGRWKDENPYSTFNESCSDYNTMAQQGGIKLPQPLNWNEYETYESLEDVDWILFN